MSPASYQTAPPRGAAAKGAQRSPPRQRGARDGRRAPAPGSPPRRRGRRRDRGRRRGPVPGRAGTPPALRERALDQLAHAVDLLLVGGQVAVLQRLLGGLVRLVGL